ncbi:MAG: class I SAM-dependent methyltransferase [Candidatus Nealsonbacteria bacterium]
MRNPQEYYNANSRGYVQKWDLSQEGLKRPRNYYRLKIIESLIKLASIKQGDRVIEVGCGTGLVLREVLKLIRPVYGTDISSEMLQRVKDSVLKDKKVSIVNDLSEPNPGSDVLLAQDDLFKSKLPQKFFDKVLSMEVLRYNDDLPKCLNNVHDAMKDGGIFVFTVTNLFSFGLFPVKYNLRKLFNKIDRSRELVQYFVTERSIKKELAEADFSIIAFEKTGLLAANKFVGRFVHTAEGAEKIIKLSRKLSKLPVINQLSDTFIIAVTANPAK